MENKKTIKEMFAEVIELAQANGRDDIVEFAQGRIDALNKKAGSKKPTEVQIANEGLKTKIVDVLSVLGSGTVTEIMKADDAFADLSNQKVSSLMRQLVADGKAVKTMDKKKAIFSLA